MCFCVSMEDLRKESGEIGTVLVCGDVASENSCNRMKSIHTLLHTKHISVVRQLQKNAIFLQCILAIDTEIWTKSLPAPPASCFFTSYNTPLPNAETQLCKIIVVLLLTLTWQKQRPYTQPWAVDRKAGPVFGRASFCPTQNGMNVLIMVI